jgi:predicted nucleic acid-binding protein
MPHGRLRSRLERCAPPGRQIGWADGQIAAIATVHSCIVATRDVEPFEALGVPVINPWEEHQAI